MDNSYDYSTYITIFQQDLMILDMIRKFLPPVLHRIPILTTLLAVTLILIKVQFRYCAGAIT